MLLRSGLLRIAEVKKDIADSVFEIQIPRSQEYYWLVSGVSVDRVKKLTSFVSCIIVQQCN